MCQGTINEWLHLQNWALQEKKFEKFSIRIMIMTRLCSRTQPSESPLFLSFRLFWRCLWLVAIEETFDLSLTPSHSLTDWFSHPFPWTRSLSAVSICFAVHFCLQSSFANLPFLWYVFSSSVYIHFCPSFSSFPSLTGPCMHNQTVLFIGNYCNYTIDKQVLLAFIHAPS